MIFVIEAGNCQGKESFYMLVIVLPRGRGESLVQKNIY